MAKSFKDKMQQKAVNPTLQFISQPETEPLSDEDISTIADTIIENGRKAKGTTVIDLDTGEARPATAEEMTKIFGRKPRKASSTPKKRPQARRALPQFDEETKSRRLQVLLTPSLYDELRERASEERMSVNEMINTILKDYLRK